MNTFSSKQLLEREDQKKTVAVTNSEISKSKITLTEHNDKLSTWALRYWEGLDPNRKLEEIFKQSLSDQITSHVE